MVEIKSVCKKCDNPTSTGGIYRTAGGGESLSCPKCGTEGQKEVFVYTFEDGWELLHESGVNDEIRKLGNVYLQLVKDPLQQAQEVKRLDIPDDVKRRALESIEKAQQIIRNSGIMEELKKMGIGIRVHSLVSISV
ncbi:MAG TPA: hypothetical protein VJ792_07930 [Candidatus Nitrosotalea sp.]|nr:hypothetical protein [Candidatus Nitrosotalea sp.]